MFHTHSLLTAAPELCQSLDCHTAMTNNYFIVVSRDWHLRLMSKSRSSLYGLRGGDGGGVIAAHTMSAANEAMISNAKGMTLYQGWRPPEIGEAPLRAASRSQDFSATTRASGRPLMRRAPER